MIDVAYSTFWNDFSHYSFYGQPTSEFPAVESAPLEYNKIVGNATDDMLFADQEKFVNAKNNKLFKYEEEPNGKNKREVFSLWEDTPGLDRGLFCAHIPQDFNLDIQTNGNIHGVNPGDSKLLALDIRL